MTADGAFVRLCDGCDNVDLRVELAGGVDSPIVIRLRARDGAVKRTFRVPTGRSVDQAAAALLHELGVETV